MPKTEPTGPVDTPNSIAPDVPASAAADLHFVDEFKSVGGVFRNFEGILALGVLVACAYLFR